MNQKQRDILCRMVKTRAEEIDKELQKQFPKYFPRYSIESAFESNPVLVKTVSQKLRKEHDLLKAENDELDRKEKQLKKKWDKLFEQLETHFEKLKKSKKAAIATLNGATEQAIIDIQFAEDADAARAILDGLPSLEDLTS